MSDVAILAGAAMPLVTKLVSSCGGALLSSGVDALKLAWMAQAAGQVLLDPAIRESFDRSTKLRSLQSSTVRAMFLKDIPTILIDGLLKDTGGRNLVAMVSLWSLTLGTHEEVFERLKDFTKAIYGPVDLAASSKQEAMVCCLPAFSNIFESQVDSLYNTLATHDEAMQRSMSLNITSAQEGLAGSFCAAVSRCSRDDESWLEAVNCFGLTDCIVTMAMVTGLRIAADYDGIALKVEDRSTRDTRIASPRILVKYESKLNESRISVCKNIEVDILVSRSLDIDSSFLPPRHSDYRKLSVIANNASHRLRGMSEVEMKYAVNCCFGMVRRPLLSLMQSSHQRNKLHVIYHEMLARIDEKTNGIDDTSLSSYMLQHEHGNIGGEFSFDRRANEAKVFLSDLVYCSLMQSVYGKECEFFFVKSRQFELDVELAANVAKLATTMLAYSKPGTNTSGGGFELMASVVRAGPYVLAPRCLVEGGIPAESASLMMVLKAVIGIDGGTCPAVWHDQRQYNYETNPYMDDSNQLEEFANVDLTPPGGTTYTLEQRRGECYYRCFEAGIPGSVSSLLAAELSILRRPLDWVDNLHKLQDWSSVEPGQHSFAARIICHTYKNSSGKRLAIAAFQGEGLDTDDQWVLRDGEVKLEQLKSFAQDTGTYRILT